MRVRYDALYLAAQFAPGTAALLPPRLVQTSDWARADDVCAALATLHEIFDVTVMERAVPLAPTEPPHLMTPPASTRARPPGGHRPKLTGAPTSLAR
eukprot:scaffold2543_cov30-Tisochrysis_lutea.AAC.2